MKGIIFSSPMVRAIAAGRKTQTRRRADIDLPQSDAEIVMREGSGASVHIPDVGYGSIAWCPYGEPGDRLYVKETILLDDVLVGDRGEARAVYQADREPVPYLQAWPWKRQKLNAMFMPLGLRRFYIKIVSIGIERLQALSYQDAIAEGAFAIGEPNANRARWTMDDSVPAREKPHEHCLGSPQMAFANYYNVLHAGDRWNLRDKPSPWDLDPFVWVLTFTVHRRED